ncbi:R3H and coiled-coil domain-containing protein 1 isoform X2 [Oenanthe melanoleuca]|uniref:R3H and coiled-coil domain-containing protein 1 isoform X2 n=1 Tax=Oenanthe melanoleuca TaxID=2939378 RepID=UPI0024C136EB|nr:R3H and coiled-coil domain-containing protein 1 isoform X2 [Oenanthe melanoleuca]
MDGVFLSPGEDEFVGRIAGELERFLQQGQHQRVLLFPPLSSRLRYLIHRTVENMEFLSSFSVGEGWRRRTVICHSAVRLPTETTSDQKPGTNPQARFWGRGGRGGPRLRPPGDPQSPRASVGSGRITRPPRRRQDKALYVPKGTRKKENWRERETPSEGDAAPGGENPKIPTGKDGGKQQQQLEEEEDAAKGSSEHPLSDEKVPPSGNSSNSWEQENWDRDCSHKLPPQEEPEPGHASTIPAEIPEFQRQENQNSRGLEPGESSHSWAQLEEQSRSKSPAADPSRLEEQNPPGNVLEGAGEAQADDPERIQGRREEEEDKEHSGVAEALSRSLDLAAGDTEGTRQSSLEEEECTAELLAEIVGNLRVKEISIQRISLECPSPGQAQLSEGELGHVTEIYDFPSSLRTEDLLGIFSDFHESGFKIQWVDDTHALGIFSSPSTASQALGRRYPCLKIRPLIHASKQGKAKALQRPSPVATGKQSLELQQQQRL